MKKNLVLTCMLLNMIVLAVSAQTKLTIDKVYSVYLQNSGSIIENGQVKGYFLFYQSDKVDRHTNEYTLQVLDQNLNKVKEIKFNDSKNVQLLEAAYNGNALSFLFHDKDQKTLEARVYDLTGKLKYTYTRPLDKKSENFLNAYQQQQSEDYTNQQIFSINDKGFAMVIPLRDGKQYTYEVEYFSSENKSLWAFNPDDEDRVAQANFLGGTDSVIILEVSKRTKLMGGVTTASVIGLNFITKKKVFELDDSKDMYKFVPQYCTKLKNSSNMLLMGSYYDKTANLVKDFSLGLGIYVISSSGQIVSKTYNTWAKDMGKYIAVNEKGKIDDIGYLFFHNMVQSGDGNLFAIGEGYKRVADAVGIGLNVLSMAGGRVSAGGNTKIKITDMVILKFGPDYKISGATIQEKNANMFHTMIADMYSQHMVAMAIKIWGGFDYEFTTADKDANTFSVCYSDYERSKDYKGQAFHALRYTGKGFSDDKINLVTKASRMRVLPAKAGSVLIMEYFRKDKRMDLRLEKLN